MATSSIRVLIVDDYAPFRRFVCSTLQKQPELQVIGELSDGLEAVEKSAELQPDLILLDIGLPTLNGIEAARRIYELLPNSKILFVSQESSPDVVQAAFRSGAWAFVVKSDVVSELLTAIETVRRGNRFVGKRFEGLNLPDTSDRGSFEEVPKNSFETAASLFRSRREQGHVVRFYEDDTDLVDNLCAMFTEALDAGESVAAVITRSHRQDLLERLIEHGIDVNEATKTGRLTVVDAVEALNGFMDANGPNRERFLFQFGNVVRNTAAAAVHNNRPVVVFGEMVAELWARTEYENAIRLEQLWNELALTHSFYLCCAYPVSGFQGGLKGEPYSRVCAEHSEVVPAF